MSPTKAFRDDGFPVLFFQKCWHIVGRDVFYFFLKVLNECMDFDAINLTNIVLLLKILLPTNLVNIRPISLCNIIYKLITKMPVNRSGRSWMLVLSQSVFVLGRLISDNMLLSYEILHTLRQE